MSQTSTRQGWRSRFGGPSVIAWSLCVLAALPLGAVGAERHDVDHERDVHPAQSGPARQMLPTGQWITPTAARGAVFHPLKPRLKRFPHLPAGFAQSTELSPDGKTLLVLTTGYNRVLNADGRFQRKESTQFIFVFDVSRGKAVQTQVIPVSNTYVGVAFAPGGDRFYVPGAAEDNVHVFERRKGAWAESGLPIALGHKRGIGLIGQSPLASGIAVSADGRRALVVNRYNESISLLDLSGRSVLAELDLRPGKSGGVSGTPGGEYPNAVAFAGNQRAYVSSERDREVVVVDLADDQLSVLTRIPVKGNPNKMVLDAAGTTLYVACDNSDLVTLIDTTSLSLRAQVSTIAPEGWMAPEKARYKGASPDGLALSPDGQTLFVTNRGTNSVAIVAVGGQIPKVQGLIPTGWYPSDVRVSADGRMLYISNAKTLPGPNPGNCWGYGTSPCPLPDTPVTYVPNEYVLNLTGSALLSLPMPRQSEFDGLTRQVVANNGLQDEEDRHDARVMAELRERIRHVIYIVKENRTYDQVLGDLPQGNGDPGLTEFPRATTPNLHALAEGFVLLDNFHVPGDVSGNGWPWSTAARESDAGAKMLPPNYAGNGGGGSYDWEGTNRGVNVGLTGQARIDANPMSARLDADTFPGTGNVAAPDGPDGEVQQGYLWDAALRAGLSVRNYGFFVDLKRYHLLGGKFESLHIPLDREPYKHQVKMGYAANPQLQPVTDPYYRGFDSAYPDFYRQREWEREFNDYVANGNLPSLSLVDLMTDHTGSFGTAIDRVNTPEVQVADNDYAVARLVEAVARSPYAKNTLIFIVEDDAQDGPDHVDAHRSTAYVVGPYVKQGAVVKRHYTTINMLRTISDVLGIDHLGIYDAHQRPMTEVFDLAKADWTFSAVPSGLLANTDLPIPAGTRFFSTARPTQSAVYWARKTRRFDFTDADQLDAMAYNKVLWQGLMPGRPYPARVGRKTAAR